LPAGFRKTKEHITGNNGSLSG